jgi:hypothetical protein
MLALRPRANRRPAATARVADSPVNEIASPPASHEAGSGLQESHEVDIGEIV